MFQNNKSYKAPLLNYIIKYFNWQPFYLSYFISCFNNKIIICYGFIAGNVGTLVFPITYTGHYACSITAISIGQVNNTYHTILHSNEFSLTGLTARFGQFQTSATLMDDMVHHYIIIGY